MIKSLHVAVPLVKGESKRATLCDLTSSEVAQRLGGEAHVRVIDINAGGSASAMAIRRGNGTPAVVAWVLINGRLAVRALGRRLMAMVWAVGLLLLPLLRWRLKL